jgi:hypothetical protein
MTTAPEISAAATPAPQPPLPPVPPAPVAARQDRQDHQDHRHMGKVAQLPKPIRDRLNQMLRDGITYREIIVKLGDDGKNLNEPNICLWFQGGYQDWLKQQDAIENERAKWEFAADALREDDTNDIAQVALQVAVKQIYKALSELTPDSLENILDERPDEYVRLINALSRLSRETLSFRKYREACIRARVENAKLLDPRRKFTEEETLAIVDKVDEILGFK